MKAHVHNPWTRSPRVHVSLSVEEATQLLGYLRSRDQGVPCTPNQGDAFDQLRRTLEWTVAQAPPHGIKGVLP